MIALKLKGSRIEIDKLKLEDVFCMREWGTHENPLLEDYNFPDMNDSEIKVWFRMKTCNPCNKYYSIKNSDSGNLIGYMGIKDIKILRKNSTLGIVLDPNQTDKGYGTEILYTFLEYYFTEMKMRKMELEVAKFNKRAYKLYEKVGFEKKKVYLEEFFNQYLDLNDPYYVKEKSSFEIKCEKIYNYIYEMTLTKKRFFETREIYHQIQHRS